MKELWEGPSGKRETPCWVMGAPTQALESSDENGICAHQRAPFWPSGLSRGAQGKSGISV